jgi:hypothetical protein
MTLLWKFLAGWVLLSGLCSLLLVVAVHCCKDPLACLDGRRLACVLDDRDRAFLLDVAEANSAAYEYAEREAMELDSLWALPAVEHP